MIIGRCPADVHCKLDILEATGSDDIFHYLSKNEEYTEYKQTDEEKLKEYVRQLAVAKARDEEKGLAEGAKGDFSKILLEAQAWGSKHARFNNLFLSPHGVKFLLDLQMCGPHFMNSKIFKMGWLARMTKVHGGVSAMRI